jgi:acetylornithine deacetylase
MGAAAGNAAGLIREIAALVAIPSVSSVLPARDMSNAPLIGHLAGRFETLGFECRVEDVPDCIGKSNLVATLGRGTGGLILAGHTDTVPCDPSLWSSDPFVLAEREQRLYGLGTADMKSFFALAAAAVAGLPHEQLRAPLVVLATADEESSMAGARALAAAGEPRACHALIGEPTNLRPVRLHKGILMERIVLDGRSGHSSDPALGASALEGMHGVIAALLAWRQELIARHRDERFVVPHPTLNFGRIAGGDNPNRICGHCELDVDLRCLPGMDIGALRSELRARVGEAVGQTPLQVRYEELLEGVPPMETPRSAAIVRAAEELTGAPSGAVAFSTEAPFLARLGADVVILGAGSIDQAHQPDEYLELRQIPRMVEYLRQLIRRFCLQ